MISPTTICSWSNPWRCGTQRMDQKRDTLWSLRIETVWSVGKVQFLGSRSTMPKGFMDTTEEIAAWSRPPVPRMRSMKWKKRSIPQLFSPRAVALGFHGQNIFKTLRHSSGMKATWKMGYSPAHCINPGTPWCADGRRRPTRRKWIFSDRRFWRPMRSILRLPPLLFWRHLVPCSEIATIAELEPPLYPVSRNTMEHPNRSIPQLQLQPAPGEQRLDSASGGDWAWHGSRRNFKPLAKWWDVKLCQVVSSCVKLCQVVSSWQFLHAAVSPEKMEDLQHDLSGVRLQLETVPW